MTRVQLDFACGGSEHNVRQLDTYDKLLAAAAEPPAISGDLCLFPTQVGSAWSGGLLVCGRAVNGYDPPWQARTVATASARAELLSAIAAKHAGSPCPMAWISKAWGRRDGYNTARSAFWRVTRAVSRNLGVAPENDGWSSSLAWANLYRIAPAKTGNPDTRLQRRQIALCQEQLRIDIKRYRPRYVLFMTGSDWAAPFVPDFGVQWSRVQQLVQAMGALRFGKGFCTLAVIAKHPQGKPHVRMVNEVVQAFRAVA